MGELVTGFDESYSAVAALTLPAMRRYAERHGLGFSVSRFERSDRAAA
jgi:hypothetical protein